MISLHLIIKPQLFMGLKPSESVSHEEILDLDFLEVFGDVNQNQRQKMEQLTMTYSCEELLYVGFN
jgi:hypothetical protein